MCPGTLRQQKIMVQVTNFFRQHGRQVLTLPLERIAKQLQKPQPKTQQVRLAL